MLRTALLVAVLPACLSFSMSPGLFAKAPGLFLNVFPTLVTFVTFFFSIPAMFLKSLVLFSLRGPTMDHSLVACM